MSRALAGPPIIQLDPRTLRQGRAVRADAQPIRSACQPRRSTRGRARHDAGLRGQLLEHSVGVIVGQPGARHRDEHRRCPRQGSGGPERRVATELIDHTGVQQEKARLAELGAPDGEDSGVEVEVGDVGPNRFIGARGRDGQQPDQRLEGRRPRPLGPGQPRRSSTRGSGHRNTSRAPGPGGAHRQQPGRRNLDVGVEGLGPRRRTHEQRSTGLHASAGSRPLAASPMPTRSRR